MEPVLEKLEERGRYVVQPGYRVIHSVQGGGWGLHRFLPSQTEVPSESRTDRHRLNGSSMEHQEEAAWPPFHPVASALLLPCSTHATVFELPPMP